MSLSLPAGDGEDGELGDFVPDEVGTDPAETTAAHAERDEVRHLLSHLSAHQADVLRLRYGLDGGRPRSLEEVGAELHISRERVRQLEARAMRRLRDDDAARSLRRASCRAGASGPRDGADRPPVSGPLVPGSGSPERGCSTQPEANEDRRAPIPNAKESP